MKFDLSVQQWRQLLAMNREHVVNSIMYSDGHCFLIELGRYKSKFRLTISNYGRNQDCALSDSGYLLKGIRDRVATLGCTVHFLKLIEGFKTTIEF